MEQPELVESIWDNGGETFDRYTICLEDGDMLGLSDNPSHPQGFSQFTTGTVGPHLGHELEWTELPEQIQRHIAARLS